MSVIAGCSLFKSLLLISDCRVTVFQPGKFDIYCDNVQKIFPLSAHSALGFVGDLKTAAPIIREVNRQLREKEAANGKARLNAVVLSRWLPRFLKSAYVALSKRWSVGRVDFMLGGIYLDRPNVVERSRVVEIMERFRLGKLSAQRSWLPSILVEILKMPPDKKYILLSDIPLNILCYMQSPDFIPQFVPTLGYAAIGSGGNVVVDIDKNADWIFAGDVGNPFVEAMALRETVSEFIEKNDVKSVGGMYPVVYLSASGSQWLGFSAEIPYGGTKVELSIDSSDGRWVQKNVTTGKEVKLLYPWEVETEELKQDIRFDDLKEALSQMRNPVKDA